MIIEITNQNSRDSPSYIMQIVPSDCVILLTCRSQPVLARGILQAPR